ncbi:cystatin-like fold lipoprotein [Staphylococcus sp. 18_1_E_LY]|uniref:Cystatin-like fold lipoprotein n=1 Tax=Staphylococcus lloydii TaxID=2781774 RepID=A0A7T1F9U8_9STAP|nr:cystatin-like fold lipoprotein [Staphylococcus lloydii]MBF7020326.1 cystatin-like fold lipoprotein [Staphylococcus lloydii]MBF7028009.1 cystatin-like fold lipoprotein [Staphylococcus lloydii]QPM75675.1 cystatin-like fold lipoprotein [Staphylococcus lloydii]
MKKLLFSFIAVTVLLAGCSSGKYADKIDKAVKAQEKYQKKLAKGQKGDAEAHYYTYKFNNNKPKIIKDFNSKGYVQEHKADYKEENMNKN